jgi:hypothetical protein
MTEQMQDNPLVMGAAAGAQTAQVEAKLRLEGQLKGGASWFYWIAILSLVNSILSMSGSTFGFIFGLGITQVFDAIGIKMAEDFGAGAKVFAFLLNCVIAAVYIVFGVFSNKRYSWAFIVGLVFYGLDGGLCLIAQDWLSLAFHAFAGFSIFKGMQAGKELNKLSATPA